MERRWARKFGVAVLVASAIGMAVSAMIYALQDSMLYYPAKYSTEQLEQAAAQRSLAPWPAPDSEYLGFVTVDASGVSSGRGPSGSRGTVVVFHGNAGSALDRVYYTAALEPLGFRVVLAEYPGYGAKTGQPSEETLVSEGKATVRRAAKDLGGPLYIWGESLGCGVATAVAADPALPVEGLALITPFTNLPDLAQSLYWYLPVRRLVRDQYDNVVNLRHYHKPVALLVAERDELMPRAQADALYESLTSEKRMWVFPGAGHNTWPIWPEEGWWQEVVDFFEAE